MINDIDFLLKTSNIWNVDLFEWLLQIHCKQSHPYILQMIYLVRDGSRYNEACVLFSCFYYELFLIKLWEQ